MKIKHFVSQFSSILSNQFHFWISYNSVSSIFLHERFIFQCLGGKKSAVQLQLYPSGKYDAVLPSSGQTWLVKVNFSTALTLDGKWTLDKLLVLLQAKVKGSVCLFEELFFI